MFIGFILTENEIENEILKLTDWGSVALIIF